MKHKIKFLALYLVCASFLGLFSNTSFALDKGFQAISFFPVTDNGPYVGIWGSKNLSQLEWNAGTQPFTPTVLFN